MNEGLARKTRSLREIPEEVRRKNNIQKMKSSVEMVVAACAISKFLAEREMRTSSTGSVYYTEEYVDYNKFLSYLVELLKELGSSWLPEGDLIFKCDEGISQASIRDTATRASLVNMSNLSPHIFNLMRDQRKESARFFGRMCEAFLEKRVSSDVISNLRKKLWEYGQCDSLFESINLGLNGKVKKKFDDKTSGNMIEEMGVLDVEEFKELFCEEFSKIKYFENVHIGHDIGIGKFHHTFIFCHIIPSLKHTVNDVICRLCHETKKFRVVFSCKKGHPKKAELLGQIHANGIISYSFGVYKKSPDDFKFFTDDKEQADMTIPNVIEAKRYVEECLDDIVESLSLKEDFSLGLSKKVQKRYSEKSIDDIKELHTLSPDKFKEELIKYIFENYNITQREENFNNWRYGNYYYIDKGVKIHFKRSGRGISIILDETNQKFLMYVDEERYMYTFREEMADISVEGWLDKYGYNGSDKDDYAFDLTLDNMHRLVDFGLEERCGFKKIQKIEEANLGLNTKVKKKFDNVDAVDSVSQIHFEDPEVERICHEHGVYTYEDAARVSSIKGWFEENEAIKSFNELKFFTGLNEIEAFAFAKCKYLQSINIPNSVTSIGLYSFSECKSLQSVIIPGEVTSIEESAFSYCSNLQSITIPNSVTSIGNWAFVRCGSLQSVVIPNSVTSIEFGSFYKCSSLQSIAIPNSVTSIGESAFHYCTSLQSVNIPNSVTSIGEEAFARCENLQAINISKNCPVYNQIKKEYPDIQFIEPKVNESSNLGLNSKVKKKFDKVDAVDNITEYVDLGLPSGNLWTKCNVGAEKEEDYGEYFTFDDANSKYVLPTDDEFKELVDNCSWKYDREKNGLVFTSYINKKSILFPFSGYISLLTGIHYGEKDYSFYWTSTKDECQRGYAFYINYSEHVNFRQISIEDQKQTIRPIIRRNKVVENKNLGLNSKVKKKFDKVDAVDNLEFEFVDLGLPSGNIWTKQNVGSSDVNDAGSLLNHSEAIDAAFENKLNLPTTEDFKELMKYCHIEWVDATYSNTSISGLELTSLHNGNKIFFPAGGHYDNKYNTHVENLNKFCYYWTQTKSNSKMPGEYFMSLISGNSSIKNNPDGCYGFWHSKSSDALSVRLINKKD